MANEGNWLSTPEGYATPEQVKSTYDYAKALLSGGHQQPVKHWTQGVSNIVSALVGGGLDYRAGQQERARRLFNANQDPTVTSMNPIGQKTPVMGTPFFPNPSGNTPLADASGIDKVANTIAGIESGGKYDAVGPVANKTGDKAYGKYQVMGANIPEWTESALGKRMTPEQFLADPKAQETVFANKFGEYAAKYGPEGAAKAWFAGEKGMNNPNAKDVLGTTVEGYGKKFSNSFAGPSDFSQAPAVKAMGSALRGEASPDAGPTTQVAGDPQVAAAVRGATPTSPVMPAQPAPTGQIYIDPALVPKQRRYTPEQFRNIMANEEMSDAMKMTIRQEAAAQNQPVSIPYMGGAVVVNPNDPTKQQFIPEGKWGTSKIGDIERQVFQYPDGKGGVIQAPVIRPPAGGASPVPGIGPRSDGAPAAAPVVPVPAGGPIPPTLAENAPTAPAGGPEIPIQVSSTDPTAGISATVPKPAVLAAATDNTPTPAPLTRLAQLGPPPGIDPTDWEAYSGKKAFDNKMDIDLDSQKKGAEAAVKKYDNLSTQAQSARKLMPNLDLALALMSDPNFHSGLLSGVQDTWSRFKSAALGDKYANAPNESFDKLMAGTVLDTMKSTLAGLGQVRLAEIDLLNRANANRYNTDASNRAVLEISRRAIQKVDQLDSMGQQYASGDEVTDPVTGKVMLKANVDKTGEIAPRHGLDVGFDKIARKFTLDHPSFNADEVKNYQNIFDTGRTDGEKTAAGKTNEKVPAAPKKGDIQVFEDGKGGKIEGQWDGTKWGPKK